MDNIIAELNRCADVERAREAYDLDVLYRLAAHLLSNGGGCATCHGSGKVLSPVTNDEGDSLHECCPVCHGTGIDDPARELLAALGVQQ